MTVSATTPIELVEAVYGKLPGNAQLGRERLGRPLTLAEVRSLYAASGNSPGERGAPQ